MMKKIKSAFTMLELVFVIVIIGLLSTFGVEFMVQSYQSYIFSNINNRLQNESATAIEFIAKRLSHRIKDSVIARDLSAGNFVGIQNVSPTGNYTVLEWVGSNIDGFRGTINSTPISPDWSGIIDLDADIGFTNRLTSPETNTTAINAMIKNLSYNNSDINDSALYFVGSNSDIFTDYGWSGTNNAYLQDQNGSMHPIKNDTDISVFLPPTTDFSGVDVYEYYKHTWTAYAIVHSNDNNLTLYYDYQPWNGDTYTDASQTALIMQNVTTFKYKAIGSIIKIQLCVASELAKEEYAICKEKTIY